MSGVRGTVTCLILFLLLNFASFVVSVPHVRRNHVMSINGFNNGTVTPMGPFPPHLLADGMLLPIILPKAFLSHY